MALYRLLNDDGSIVCEGDAMNDDHALKVIGVKIGKTLAFDSPDPHAYTLQRVDTNQTNWNSGEGLAVHVISPTSN